MHGCRDYKWVAEHQPQSGKPRSHTHNMPEALPAVVCDNGTGYVKCGFSRANFPAAVFPALVGRPSMKAAGRRPASSGGPNTAAVPELPDVVVGEDANRHRQFLNLQYPMENGVIRDWDGMTALWEHTFGRE